MLEAVYWVKKTMSCLPKNIDNLGCSSGEKENPKKRPKRKFVEIQNVPHLEKLKEVVNDSKTNNEKDDLFDLQLDPLIEGIPFLRILGNREEKTEKQDIVLVTRAYEEQFLRECMNSSETPCIWGSQCECMILDPHEPFVAVQFSLPNAIDNFKKPNGMCLLCLRKCTQIIFYQTIHKGQSVSSLIQRHGNICDQPGEYHRNAMLICPPSGPINCMPLPIVAHQRSNYEVIKRQGIRWIIQKNVNYEDFV